MYAIIYKIDVYYSPTWDSGHHIHPGIAVPNISSNKQLRRILNDNQRAYT